MVDNREGLGEDPKFFIGVEVERSPLYGKQTLFVVGIQNPKEILTRCLNNKIDHVYLGAGFTFEPEHDNGVWDEWHYVIRTLLEADVWVTLDFDSKYAQHPWFLEMGWCEHTKFVPMVSVRMPYVEQWNYNTTVKIDDTVFKGTNPGVWCHRLHKLRDPDHFTSWSEYVGDQTID